jgi:hypothetical protein
LAASAHADRYGPIVVTWIVVGAIVLGVVILAASVALVVGRLRPLRDANRRLRIRLEQADKLRSQVETLQQNLLVIQEPLTEAVQRSENLADWRRNDDRPRTTSSASPPPVPFRGIRT